MNKFKRILPFAVLAVLVAGILYIGFRAGFYWLDNVWMYNVDFDEYDSDYQAVAKLLTEEFGDGEYTLKYDRTKGTANVRIISEDRDVAVTGDTVPRISRILDSSQGDLSISRIVVDGELVAFQMDLIEGPLFGGYALVYSSEGKPTYFNEMNEEGKLYVKKVGGNWYNVRLILDGKALHYR